MESFVVMSGGGIGFQPLMTSSSPFLSSTILHTTTTTTTTKNNKNHCNLNSTDTNFKEFDLKPSNISSFSTPTLANATKASYSTRQAAIVDIQRAPDLNSALARYGEILQVQDLNVILRYFGNLNRWRDVSQIFDWMLKHDEVNVASYSSFIKFMGKSFNPVRALEVYNSIQDESLRTHASICNSILGCLVRNGKFESCIELFDQMKQGGLMPDVVTYSTLLAGCTKYKHGFSKALRLVQEMKENGLHMDGVIYGTLLAVCASNNQREEAESFFQQMRDEGFKPNVFHYSSLLNAYALDGIHTKADSLVKDMKSAGLVPNKVILTTLLKVYVRGGLFEKSRELLAELETLGFAQDEMPYCLLMDGLAKAGQINEAKSVLDEMEKKDVKSDGYSHSIMISAFCRNGLLTEAKQLAKDFEAKHDKYDLVMSNTMLKAYCKAGEMESVMQMLRKMDELKISPDWNTFHILIKYFYKEKLYQLAYRTMVDMHSKGHQPDEELCSSLILQLGQVHAPSEAFAVYNMLRYSNRTMRKVLHEKMLNILVAGGVLKDAYLVVKDNAERISDASLKKFAISYMKSGNINLINDVVKAVHSSGRKIDQEVFHMAVSRYIENPEKKELFLQLLHWMTGQGYVVDSHSRNLVLKNADLFGRHLIAEVLSKQHRMSKALRTPLIQSH